MSQNAHDLLPQSIAKELPSLSELEHESDPLVRVRWNTLDASRTWFVVGYDPAARLCHGLVDADGSMTRCCFDVEDAHTVASRVGTYVERDLSWEPVPLSRLERAFDRGR